SPASPTVAQALEDFAAAKGVEQDAETLDWYVRSLKSFRAMFGHRPVNSITFEDGLAYRKWLARGKGWDRGDAKGGGVLPRGRGGTRAGVGAAKSLCGWVAKPGRAGKYGTTTNPWSELKFRPEKPRERILTAEEFLALLDNCTDGACAGGARDFREQLTVLRG